MRAIPLLSFTLSLLCLVAPGAGASRAPDSGALSGAPLAPGTQSLIVKFRETPDRPAAAKSAAQGASAVTAERARAAAVRAGLVLAESREIGAGLQAVKLRTTSSGDTLATTLARLRADPSVEYAEPDHRRYVQAAPDDPIFQGSQWYLKNGSTTPSAIDAVSAWDTTQGSNDVVVAVVDTGVRFEHPDLRRVSAGGRLLDGYDFITDVTTANDGDGRDADASDPGDWCNASGSSWHGTRVSGIVGALTNNATGIAGLTWRGRILPARGLGKCGGNDSDLIAATLWAAGLPVPGVPDNPNPAKVINLSFGSAGACPASWRDAIARVSARGALVVVSAGNDGGSVGSPANCPGAAAIGAIRHAGTKVGFSNLGREVALSAPGGNCVNPTGACLYSIDTTSNAGATSPAGSTYTDQFDYNVGTSFSAPIVVGIAALMTSVNGRLGSAQLIRRLQDGSKPFPKSTDPSIPDCQLPSGSTDVQTSECNCTTATCGAGMANARGAVLEALRPAAVAVASPTTAAAGQTVTLDGTGSFAANGRTITAHSWTVVASSGPAPAIANAGSPNASFTTTDGGAVALRLTVTDDQGAQDFVDVSINGEVPTITVTVSPGTASVRAGSGTQTFSATVANTTNAAVTWQVNGVTGGNATVGTISAAGLYTAPATVPSPATVTVRAISSADSARSGSAQVTVTAAPSTSGANGGGGGGGGAIDAVWLLAGLMIAALRWAALRATAFSPEVR